MRNTSKQLRSTKIPWNQPIGNHHTLTHTPKPSKKKGIEKQSPKCFMVCCSMCDGLCVSGGGTSQGQAFVFGAFAKWSQLVGVLRPGGSGWSLTTTALRDVLRYTIWFIFFSIFVAWLSVNIIGFLIKLFMFAACRELCLSRFKEDCWRLSEFVQSLELVLCAFCAMAIGPAMLDLRVR